MDLIDLEVKAAIAANFGGGVFMERATLTDEDRIRLNTRPEPVEVTDEEARAFGVDPEFKFITSYGRDVYWRLVGGQYECHNGNMRMRYFQDWVDIQSYLDGKRAW